MTSFHRCAISGRVWLRMLIESSRALGITADTAGQGQMFPGQGHTAWCRVLAVRDSANASIKHAWLSLLTRRLKEWFLQLWHLNSKGCLQFYWLKYGQLFLLQSFSCTQHYFGQFFAPVHLSSWVGVSSCVYQTCICYQTLARIAFPARK